MVFVVGVDECCYEVVGWVFDDFVWVVYLYYVGVFVEDYDLVVEQECFVDVVGDEDDCFVEFVLELQCFLLQVGLYDWVDCVEWFVYQQDVGICGEFVGYVYVLLLFV